MYTSSNNIFVCFDSSLIHTIFSLLNKKNHLKEILLYKLYNFAYSYLVVVLFVINLVLSTFL